MYIHTHFKKKKKATLFARNRARYTAWTTADVSEEALTALKEKERKTRIVFA